MAQQWREYLGSVEDPRAARGVRHRLDEVLMISLCAVLCGAEDGEDIAEYGRSKAHWFRTFMDLPHGIPCAETFRRILANVRPDSLERCLSDWLKGWKAYQRGPLVAVDGKRLRRSFDRASGKAAVHMISAWATQAGVALAQLAVQGKSNEITALPDLLRMLDVDGATVSLDAMGCQRAIAGQLVGQRADYVLAVKANQPLLHEEAKLFLDTGIAKGFEGQADYHEESDKGHGRIETRRAWASEDIAWFADKARWPGLRSFAAVECERSDAEKTSRERRYFVSSLPADAKRIAVAVREHWRIENSLHWVLDVAFAEDQSRLRTGHAAENFSRLRRLALSLLKQDRSAKVGIKGKRLKAGWDQDYLLKILGP